MKKHKRIIINVAGEVYETFESTLRRFPTTLLGDSQKRDPYLVSNSNEYFFNRSRKCFGAILFFYQSNGMLCCPLDSQIEIFIAECKFYQIPDDIITKMKLKEGILPQLEINQEEKCCEGERTPSLRERIWVNLEEPNKSRIATVVIFTSLLLLSVSISAACLETLPSLIYRPATAEESPWTNPWNQLELVLNSCFLFELLLRFACSPSKTDFCKGVLNWIDAIVVFPYFLVLIFTTDVKESLKFLRIFRFARVICLFRLSKYSRKLKVIGEIMKSSFEDLHLSIFCLGIIITIGGIVMYVVEKNEDTFNSIPMAFWWALQTLTTLGYGDITPTTDLGKLFSAAYMAFGALTMLLPVCSLVTFFMHLYMMNIDL